MLEAGDAAPSFELPNQHGDTVEIPDPDRPVVLYFYPRADTPGCTREACAFRDNWDQFRERGIEVVGVSTDSVEDVRAFREKYDLPFTLLSDESGEVTAAYDSLTTTEIDGESAEIATRNTFVVDDDGTIARVFEDVTPDVHVDEILSFFADRDA